MFHSRYKLRTPVLNKLALLKSKVDRSRDPIYRSKVMLGIFKAYGNWFPGEEWVPSEDELRFVLDMRKQFPHEWELASNFSAQDWDKKDDGHQVSWAEVDRIREEVSS